ncbi:MAG: hypothetical protein IPP64_03060 [Bacteroidetes bacterium]|nr:hypothetical protein [Bacteroidota bacterium]
MRNLGTYLSIVLFLTIAGCGNERLDVDLSETTVPEISMNRLEQDIFRMDTTDVAKATKQLQAKYGRFYTTFISVILNNGGLRDSSYAFRMKSFISDFYMKKAFDETQKKYPSTDVIRQQLSEAYKYFNYHFPNRSIPQPITMISGFNYSVVVADSTMAIGLETYLGSNNEFYKGLGVPRYKSMFMNEENIIPDAIRQWMLIEFPNNMNKTDFLSEIVYMGKIMYLTDALLPNVPDSLKIQYSIPQMEYCKQNEFNVWSYFAAKKMLYTTDQAEIAKFTSDGPFTSALSKEAPSRIGHWMGWQLVRQYMNNNPTTSLQDLINEKDAQLILSKSKYKPGK